MAATEVAIRVREAIASMAATDFNNPRLMEVLNLSQQLVDTMQTFFGALDNSIYGEFNYIATYIAKTREADSTGQSNAGLMR